MDAYDRCTNLEKKLAHSVVIYGRGRELFLPPTLSLRAVSLAKSSNFERKDAPAMINLVGSQMTAIHMLTSNIQFYTLL
jgi:hypothetical protein